jgi:hypothetical protein
MAARGRKQDGGAAGWLRGAASERAASRDARESGLVGSLSVGRVLSAFGHTPTSRTSGR